MIVERIETVKRRAAGLLPNLAVAPIEEPHHVEGDKILKIELCETASLFRASDAEVTGKGNIIVNGDKAAVLIAGQSQLINCGFHVRGRNSTVYIGRGCKLQNVQFNLNGDDCFVVIGEKTTWESGAALVSGTGRTIAIGDDCMLASGVIMRTEDGHDIFDLATRAKINVAKDIVVNEHVWLGNSVRVAKGTNIGAGCVVGQLSLATGKLKPKCVYGGLPARLIRKNVGWARGGDFETIPVWLQSPDDEDLSNSRPPGAWPYLSRLFGAREG